MFAGLVDAVAVKFSAVTLSVLASDMVVSLAMLEPASTVTLITCGFRFSSGVLPTLSVTGMLIGAAVEPGAEMVRVPVQVCAVVKPLVFTLTVTCAGWPDTEVCPDEVVADRNPPQVVLLVETLYASGAPVLVNVMV